MVRKLEDKTIEIIQPEKQRKSFLQPSSHPLLFLPLNAWSSSEGSEKKRWPVEIRGCRRTD
jgi:hypothetical protein